jgi:hypothetical protein
MNHLDKNSDFGIVLKRCFPYKKKIIILSRLHGKIECSPLFQNDLTSMWPGMVIKFNPERRGRRFVLHNSDKEFVPSKVNLKKLEWIQYILNVSSDFLQFEDPSSEVFDFLKNLLFILNKTNDGFSKVVKCSSLVHLLSLFGFGAGEHGSKFSEFFFLVSTGVVDHEEQGRVEFAAEIERELATLIPYARRHVFEALSAHPRLVGQRIIGFDE